MGAEGLIIDWTQNATYNTIMAVSAGVALISLALAGKRLVQNKAANPKGWALNFGVLGLILTITGTHFTLAWPLADFPYDNIIFGEPSLLFGVILLALSLYFWQNSERLTQSENPLQLIAKHFRAFSILLYAITLIMIAIFFAGVIFQFFAAPPEEPITGYFSQWPWLEAWVLSLIYLIVGLASLLTANGLKRASQDKFIIKAVDKINYLAFMISGWFFLIFGAYNYFTHIGLIIHTMPNS
ncbi:MAG TPA: DUF981 family protein [Balneolaceae bacterium]|nr:DUF981 family protein [Balneolaceae bacterium]